MPTSTKQTKKTAKPHLGEGGEATTEPKTTDVFGQNREYIAAIGRRKTASAQVRLYQAGKGRILVNEMDLKKYFPLSHSQQQILAPLEATGKTKIVDISALVRGGGKNGQAEAVRHGIARALLKLEPTTRGALKPLDFITRDSRKKERKKPGLKRARRAPQWAKR